MGKCIVHASLLLSDGHIHKMYIAAVDYQQLADNTVEKSCVFDTRD